METKHALKTKIGLKDKKIEKLEAQLAVEPKSPTGESLKESIRMFVSLLVGMGVAWIYSRYPILGELQPDQTVFVAVLSSIFFRSLDKFWFQLQKNKGQVGHGVGIDRMFVAFGGVFNRAKTQPVQIEENKK